MARWDVVNSTPCLRLVRTPEGWVLREESTEGLRVREDSRGRRRVCLPVQHPYANRGGWQWVLRFLAMEELGRRLRSDEHAHHENGDLKDDRTENCVVVVAWYHGQLHAYGAELAGRRDKETGRWEKKWREYKEPIGPFEMRRKGAVIHL